MEERQEFVNRVFSDLYDRNLMAPGEGPDSESGRRTNG